MFQHNVGPIHGFGVWKQWCWHWQHSSHGSWDYVGCWTLICSRCAIRRGHTGEVAHEVVVQDPALGAQIKTICIVVGGNE